MNDHVHLKIGIRCLTCVGFWPLKLKNTFWKTLYNFYFVLTMSVYVIFVPTQLIEMYFLRNANLEDISFLMGAIFLYLLGFFKVWIIGGPGVKRLTQKVQKTEAHILKADTENVVKLYKMCVHQNYVANTALISIVVICAIMFDISPIFTEMMEPPTSLFDIIDNSTRVYRARPLPLSSWFPINRYKHYNICYVWHVLILATIPTYLVACDIFFYGLIIFPIGQLKILQQQLRTIREIWTKTFKQLDEVIVADNLRKCIEYHKAIITFVEELSQAMRTFLILDFVACGLQMAVIGFQVAVTNISFHLFTTLVFLLTMSIQLFLFYWFGNEILIESEGVAKAIWESQWFLCSANTKRSLLIVMIRAQKPLTLSVGPFYNVSTSTMMLVVRTGYSYAAIMRRLYSH